jgi:hypothetical protein
VARTGERSDTGCPTHLTRSDDLRLDSAGPVSGSSQGGYLLHGQVLVRGGAYILTSDPYALTTPAITMSSVSIRPCHPPLPPPVLVTPTVTSDAELPTVDHLGQEKKEDVANNAQDLSLFVQNLLDQMVSLLGCRRVARRRWAKGSPLVSVSAGAHSKGASTPCRSRSSPR